MELKSTSDPRDLNSVVRKQEPVTPLTARIALQVDHFIRCIRHSSKIEPAWQRNSVSNARDFLHDVSRDEVTVATVGI